MRRGLGATAGNLKFKLPCVALSTLLRLSLSSFLLSGISSMAPHLTAAEGGWAVVQAAVRPPMAQLWPNYGPTMAQSMAQLWPN